MITRVHQWCILTSGRKATLEAGMDRRGFLAGAAALPAAAFLAEGRLPIKKALYISMLPRTLGYADRFKMGRRPS